MIEIHLAADMERKTKRLSMTPDGIKFASMPRAFMKSSSKKINSVRKYMNLSRWE
jgi:hypothetical protein